MNMGKRKVSAKDVAQYSGVSAATVSMILNGKSSKFSERTCQKVIDACNELGYVHGTSFRPNSNDDKVLIAIVPTLSNLYFVQAVESMQRRAKELGYSLLTFDTCRERTQEALIIHICSRYPFPGVVFLYPPENNLLLQQLELAKPVMHIYDKGVYSEANILEFDGVRVGSIIAKHLYDFGHRRIAFLSMDFETKQAVRTRRLAGLRSVYEENGLNPIESVILCTPETELPQAKTLPEGYELGYMITKQLVDRKENVTAIVGLNDMVAMGAMDAIIDAGLRVPEDYSVCGCDNTSIAKFRRVSLTSVDSYPIQIGREAIGFLVKKIEHTDFLSGLEDNPVGVTRMEYFPRLIPRKSTGPAKG